MRSRKYYKISCHTHFKRSISDVQILLSLPAADNMQQLNEIKHPIKRTKILTNISAGYNAPNHGQL